MASNFTISSVRLIFITTTFLLFATSEAIGAAICGPGNHWVDTCTPGTYTLGIHIEFGIDTDLDNVTDFEAQFDGTMIVQRGVPQPSDPSGSPAHNDFIRTEILSMQLAGSSPETSGWTFLAGVNQGLAASTGIIKEYADFPESADHRYDMVFEITGTPYGRLHHENTTFFFEEPDLLRSPEIGSSYHHFGGPFGTIFKMFDDTETNVIKITDLFNTDHATFGRPNFVITSIVPVPGALWLFISGLVFLGIKQRHR